MIEATKILQRTVRERFAIQYYTLILNQIYLHIILF